MNLLIIGLTTINLDKVNYIEENGDQTIFDFGESQTTLNIEYEEVLRRIECQSSNKQSKK